MDAAEAMAGWKAAMVLATVVVALVFDAVNGAHDAANSIATVVSTRVLAPRTAVAWAAFFNFVAMFLFEPTVADTISKIITVPRSDFGFVLVVLAGLAGAIFWNLLTWHLGIPSSSSHALIGGLAGAGAAHAGLGVLHWQKIMVALLFIPLAPILGMVCGLVMMVAVAWAFRRQRPGAVDRSFRTGQLFSAALYSIGHGGNDAQKTMGVLVALLVAAGWMAPGTELTLTRLDTAWIILGCHLAMAIGTAMGGWKIVKTMGMRLCRLQPVGGFCAETGGAATLFLATHLGIPVSTTHTITGSIIGAGAARRFSAVKWGVAGRLVWAWILTIPMSALAAAACYLLLALLPIG